MTTSSAAASASSAHSYQKQHPNNQYEHLFATHQHQQLQQQQHHQQLLQEQQLQPSFQQSGGGIYRPQLERDDSLEYYIKFPTATTSDGARNNGHHHGDMLAATSTSTAMDGGGVGVGVGGLMAGGGLNVGNAELPLTEAESVFLLNEATNVPIVLLLGWAGCQDKYLMKYSKIYEDRGLITVRYTAPVENLFWKRNAMKPIGEKILKLIFDMNFDNHPLIFHVFSNGGAYLYQHIALAIRKSKRPVQVQGTIFDSAPGDRKMIGLYRAISAIYGKQKRLNAVVALLMTVGLMLVWFVEDMYHRIRYAFRTASDPAQANPFHNLKDEENRWPQLFLYSRKDLLIPYTDVERFARYRQNRHGVSVQMVCFEEAEHVKLLTSQPHRYIQTVCKFISDCLAIYQCNKFNTNSKID